MKELYYTSVTGKNLGKKQNLHLSALSFKGNLSQGGACSFTNQTAVRSDDERGP